MMNSLFLPLYLDGSLLNSLYTIIGISADVNISKISTKNQERISFDTPISEITKDTCGRYVQGSVHVDLSSEVSLTRELILIHSFITIKRTLQEKNMLKTINNEIDLKNLRDGEYVELRCELEYDPKIKYFEELINLLEIQLAMNVINDTEGELKIKDNPKKDAIDILKNQIERIKKDQCNKLVSEKLFGTKARAVIPVQDEHVLDHIEHLYNTNMSILGKVSRICTNKDVDLRVYNQNAIHVIEKFFKEKNMSNSSRLMNLNNKVNNLNEDEFPIVEIIPISIYL